MLGCPRSVTLKRNEDISGFLQYANRNRSEGFFNDATIEVGSLTLSVNRMILSYYSGFFEEKFRTNQDYQFSVSLNDVDEQSVISLIEYMYTEEITIDNGNVISIISTADALKMNEIKEQCFEFLKSILSFDTCFEILSLGKRYERNSLKEEAYKFISENFDEIYHLQSFKALSFADVLSCITNLNRVITNEMLVYKAIVLWTKHDAMSRQEKFEDLFKLLELEQLPSEYLASVVSKESLVRDNPTCAALVLDIVTKFMLKLDQLALAGSRVISLGGRKTPTTVMEVYNLHGKSKTHFPEHPVGIDSHGSVNLENTVYRVGGIIRDGQNHWETNTAWKMDLHQERLDLHRTPLEWQSIAPMSQMREGMGATVYDNSLVVAGGFHGDSTLTSVEFYRKGLNEWNTISPLQQCRGRFGLTACDNCLYAIGGESTNRYKYFSSVERLSDLDGTWEFAPPMQIPRSYAATVSLEGFIYVIGGKSGATNSSRSNSVERFDVAAEKWTYVTPMNIERSEHAACVLQEKIFVVGGKNAKGNIVKEIECYDPSHDTWSIVDVTRDELINHTLVVV